MQQKTQRPTRRFEEELKVIFLGGVGEIGKNMTALEYAGEIIVIDCGVAFPSHDMPGVDLVIPDTQYLVQNREKVKGIVLTHGHEDHIGAVPYILRDLNVPVYGSKLTLALIEPKLREHKMQESSKLNVVKPSQTISLGKNFKVEFITVSHSVAGSCALSITTPVGVVFITGDFKVDYTPVAGNVIDLQRIAEIGRNGVLLLMSESTNAERPGTTMSESTVGSSLNTIFNENIDRRILIATFASNVHRLQQIIDLAIKYNRKVAFSGRSMINVAEVARKIGELNAPSEVIVDLDKIKDIPDKNLVILTTGSQGEPMSALVRMANDEFSQIQLDYNDTVILSASPIPGNERHVYSVINNLYKRGVRVIYERLHDVHVSGHACQDELMLILSLLKPRFFIPVHGEYRHLKKHAELAMRMGVPVDNILLVDIGNRANLTSRSMKLTENVAAGQVFVDGLGVGDVGNAVIRDRKHLSEDGMVAVAIGVDVRNGIVSQIEFTSRGFVYMKESDDTVEAAKNEVKRSLANFDLSATRGDWMGVKNTIRRDLRNLLFKRTRRNPMIVVMVIEC